MILEKTNRNKAKIGQAFLALSILFIIALAISACDVENAPAGRIPSPDWSRGLPITSNVGGTPDMLVQDGGRIVHFAWSTAADDLGHIHYQQRDAAVDVVVDLDLDLPEGRHRGPRIVPAGENQVQLIWGLRIPGSRGWVLWQALLDPSGNFVGQPGPITPEEMHVGDYTVAHNQSGEAIVIWENDPAQGFWAVRMTADGLASDPVQLTESGESPGAYLEDDNTLHLTWLEESAIQYAVFPAGETSQKDGQAVANLQEMIANIQDPVVGVAGDWVYVLWSVFARTGLESGTGWTEYVAFPRGELGPSKPTRVWMLTEEEQPYTAYDGAYELTVLAPAVTSPALTSNYILEPDVATGREKELAVAVSTLQAFRLQEIVQTAVIIFNDGEFDGYEIAGKTDNFSQDGILQSDAEGYMYMAWREGTGRDLFFASTEPELRDQLNRYGGADFFLALVGGGMEAVTGALFFPLALIWFVPGALLLGIWKLRRDFETVDDASSQILLVVAILLYQGTKFLFLPSITTYIPFSAWLDVPQGLGSMLRIMVPFITLGLGILIAEITRRRRQEMSSVVYFFIACGIDALLTLMIYGVNLMGVL